MVTCQASRKDQCSLKLYQGQCLQCSSQAWGWRSGCNVKHISALRHPQSLRVSGFLRCSMIWYHSWGWCSEGVKMSTDGAWEVWGSKGRRRAYACLRQGWDGDSFAQVFWGGDRDKENRIWGLRQGRLLRAPHSGCPVLLLGLGMQWSYWRAYMAFTKPWVWSRYHGMMMHIYNPST